MKWPPTDVRFWSKVNKTDTCWTWTGALHPDGYGAFRMQGATHLAHRLSYKWTVGDPTGQSIDHICRNRACVNPDHLRLVTQKQNMENVGLSKNNRSGVRGVFWHKAGRKWAVQVGHNNRTHSGGLFESLEEAKEAVRLLRLSLFTHNDEDRRIKP